jgi:peptide/nickel transport system permease protein
MLKYNNIQLKKIVRFGILGMTLLFTIVILVYPIFSTLDPFVMDMQNILSPPTSRHWFGTDIYGRDVFARVIFGGRVTLAIAASAVGLGLFLGLPLGLLPLWAPKWLGEVVRRLVDMMLAWPGIFLALALMGLLGPGERNLVIALGLVRAPRIALVCHNTGRKVMEETFIEAARSCGAGGLHIATKHVLPNILPVLIVQVIFQLGSGITAETALSFLGVGVMPPKPSWGNVVADGKNVLQVAPWISLLAGSIIIMFVLFLNLTGDVLTDMLTPKRK